MSTSVKKPTLNVLNRVYTFNKYLMCKISYKIDKFVRIYGTISKAERENKLETKQRMTRN